MLYQDAINQIIAVNAMRDIKLIVLSLVLIVLGILVLKNDYLKKIVAVALMAFAVVCISFVTIRAVCLGLDIKNEQYVVYSGEFEISPMISDGSTVVLNGEKVIAYSNHARDYESGYYSGEVIYTKYTKYVVYMEIDSCD